MARIVICGGSVIGMTSAMLLARDGHDVTVLEAEPTPPPATALDAWESWERKGVPQFRQPHNLFPRTRAIFDADLPGLNDTLLEAGCVWMTPLALIPPGIEDWEERPSDDRFRYVTGRRPAIEWALSKEAEGYDTVTVRRGVAVDSLLTGSAVVDGAPHVTGVRTTGGEELQADLVVDATGRRTKLPEWVAAAGGTAPIVESADSGFVYYTRYYSGPERPPIRAPQLMTIGSISLLTLWGDNDTWSLTIFTRSDDTELRAVRDPERFDRVVRALPPYVHWLDSGEPITDVLAMAGIVDRYRRYVVDDRPVVTGIAPVGDAWACTNPSAGRGITVGVVHAQKLRDTVRGTLADGAEAFGRAWDEATEESVTPYYRTQIAQDRVRLGEMLAMRTGEDPPAPDPQMAAFVRAAGRDAEVFRAAIDLRTCGALPSEVFSRPEIADKIAAFASETRAAAPPMLSREELLSLVS